MKFHSQYFIWEQFTVGTVYITNIVLIDIVSNMNLI